MTLWDENIIMISDFGRWHQGMSTGRIVRVMRLASLTVRARLFFLRRSQSFRVEEIDRCGAGTDRDTTEPHFFGRRLGVNLVVH